MATIEEALTLAFQHHQAGDLPQAEQLYRQILQVDPTNVHSLNLLGVLAHQVGQSQHALDYLRQAVRLNPEEASFHGNLGLVHQALGQPDKAIACLREAVRLRPEFAEAHHNLGNVFKDQGRPDEAVACFRQAVQLRPDDANGHNDLGLALLGQGLLDEAIASFRRALQVQPDLAAAYNNLGGALASQGQFEEAATHLQEALRLQPNHPAGHNNLGNVVRALGRLDEAIDCYQRALQLWPDYPDAHNNLGNVLGDQGQPQEAAVCYREALRLRPDYAEAHYNLGNALGEQGQLDEAVACYRQALQLRPSYAEAHQNLGNALKDQGGLEEAEIHFQEACRLRPADAAIQGSLLLSLNYTPQATPALLLAKHRSWADRHAARAASPHANGPDPGCRLRIGYVSPDLRRHAVAGFVEPILAHHDARQVEVFCYAEVGVPDAITARLRSLVHGWRSTQRLADHQVAAQIRADGIDLLVDLAGHTAHNRLLVFAHKPAPIQLTYLGYPSTTGMSAIDYRLTDAVADPPGEPVCHTEELWRLPGCFCCYAPPPEAPSVAAGPALRKGHVTFGSFHSLAKLNGHVLDLWCRLLQAVPSARLLVCRHTLTGTTRERLSQEFQKRGIAGERVELEQGMPPSSWDYLKQYAEVDVLLDTFPWGGHTTACEALWMGVPVLTLAGDRHAGRMVSSVLRCLDLAEWVARTSEEYIERGVRLSEDLDGLARLRQTLRERMRASPLCDGPTFTRRLEEAYRTMWQRWCAGRN